MIKRNKKEAKIILSHSCFFPKNARGKIAIAQILVLVIGIVAVSWALGSEVGEVGAAETKVVCGELKSKCAPNHNEGATVKSTKEITNKDNCLTWCNKNIDNQVRSCHWFEQFKECETNSGSIRCTEQGLFIPEENWASNCVSSTSGGSSSTPAKTATTTPTTKAGCEKELEWKESYDKGYDEGVMDATAGKDRNIMQYGKTTPSLTCREIGYKDGWYETNILSGGVTQKPSQLGSIPEMTTSGITAAEKIAGAVKRTGAAASATGTTAGYWDPYTNTWVAATKETTKIAGGAVVGKGIHAGMWATTKTFAWNAAWAMAVYSGVKVIGKMVGMDKAKREAAAQALGVGYFVGKSVAWGFAKWGTNHVAATAASPGVAASTGTAGAGLWGMTAAQTGLIFGMAIAITWFAFSYKDTKTDKYIFTCEPWQANTGGSKCEECNKQGILGCNEYQCRSLGQSCEIINAGTSEEKCAWVNKNDVKAPEIKVSYDALLKDYSYNPTAAVSPPDRGVKVEYKSADKCVPSFTAFTFGINTNEPARCKIDYQRKNNFDDMSFFFGGSNYLLYNHTQFMSLPGSSSLEGENLSLTGAGNYDLYVKCQDSNGNANTADFVFKFCVDKGPDATPPLVVTTSIPSGNPVQFGTQKTPFEVYTNEPANCKWSIRDQDYSTMENEMSCAANAEDMNTAMLYTCETTLTDLQNKEDNTFYFRCQDTSPQKNTNTESYKFTLKGSRELVIDSVGPTNKTIKGSTESVPVTLTAKTSFGFNEGVATCQYSETDEAEKYVDFFETHSYTHSQVLVLKQGTYKYYIKCFDIAGNSDTETVSFAVEADPYAPVITRIYREDKNLKLITNKKSSCVYTTFGCSYDMKDGTKIATSDGITHLIGWETRTQFYIKCVDESKNKPLANECSVIVKPLDI